MTLATASLPPENVAGRVVLENIAWPEYEAMLNIVGDRAVRLTYDRGRLEIETPSFEHERLKSFVGRLIETYALQARVDVLPVGSTTWRREVRAGGLEADECYYVQHYADADGKELLDLSVDPPPDLAVEVDLSTSSVNKRDVYARLGVPELWRLHDDRLECLRHSAGGEYVEVPASAVLPGLSLGLVTEALAWRTALGEAEAVRRFYDRLTQDRAQ